MDKRLVAGFSICAAVSAIGVLACGLLFLACLGFSWPGDMLFNLAFGWIFYLRRVLPQVRISISGVATAAVCLGALALGLQWYLRWFAGQMPRGDAGAASIASTWPIRRTGVIIGLLILMFVAGISAVGISHQIAWLLTSPEPVIEGWMKQDVDRVKTSDNLHQVVQAMLNYHESQKILPPAAIYDRQGQPLLSWRVLILPYIEEVRLYKEFHLDESWDSPHNLRLLRRMPGIYAPLGGARKVKPYHTPYQVFVGEGAAFEGKRGLRLPDPDFPIGVVNAFNDFPDGTNTILIVEAAELVPWTKPVDLPFDRGRPLPALGWANSQDFLVALANGTVHRRRRQLSETPLRAAITRNGMEPLRSDW
jgi:hypothetical protein